MAGIVAHGALLSDRRPAGPDSARPGVGAGSSREGVAAAIAGLAGGVGSAQPRSVGAEFGAARACRPAERGDNETRAATLKAMAEVRGTLWVIATSLYLDRVTWAERALPLVGNACGDRTVPQTRPRAAAGLMQAPRREAVAANEFGRPKGRPKPNVRQASCYRKCAPPPPKWPPPKPPKWPPPKPPPKPPM